MYSFFLTIFAKCSTGAYWQLVGRALWLLGSGYRLTQICSSEAMGVGVLSGLVLDGALCGRAERAVGAVYGSAMGLKGGLWSAMGGLWG